jgi:predicted ATPase
MLNSLLINNFRMFEHLEIPSLSRVNLITGKNNTGKTSLLEAINLFSNLGFLYVIDQLLRDRDELPQHQPQQQRDEESERLLLSSYSSLFHDRKFDFHVPTSITIGDKENQLCVTLAKKIKEHVGTDYGFYVRSTLNGVFVSAFHINGSGIRGQLPAWNCQFVKSTQRIQVSPDNNLANLWDKQSLSDNSNAVLEALSILEPIERLAFIINDQSNHRKPFVKLKSGEQLPLRAFGDGISRILHIALSLVNCENGFLLIDEFENGLHYSAQESLWKVIFFLAEKLNVQVFATTHSSDTVKSFVDVIGSGEYLNKGQVIRLDNKDGKIRAIDFNLQQVQTAVEHDLEIR